MASLAPLVKSAIADCKVVSGTIVLNFFPERPSRMHPLIVAQQGLSFHPADLHSFLERLRNNSLQSDYFFLGHRKYLVTSVHDFGFCARCINSPITDGEGSIIAVIPGFVVVVIYEGSICAACKAMAATDRVMEILNQRTS